MNKISKRELRLLLAVILTSITLLWYVYWYNPIHKQIILNKINIETSKIKLNNLKKQYHIYFNEKINVLLNNNIINLNNYMIKNKHQIILLIDKIFKEAKNRKINIINSSIGQKQMLKNYSINNFLNITIIASYQQIYTFLKHIEEIRPIIQISNFEIFKINNVNKLKCNLSFIVYSNLNNGENK